MKTFQISKQQSMTYTILFSAGVAADDVVYDTHNLTELIYFA